jgi:hypothetical protein
LHLYFVTSLLRFFHSCLSATIGSTRIALRAGTQQAIIATTPSTNAAAPNTSGSRG